MNNLLDENLQSLCLKVIACNFDRFFAAFYSTVKDNFLLYLEIIQKLYCDQIVEKLCDRNALKNEHLKLVINKYTKQLDLRYLLSCDSSAIEERLQDVGSGILKFSMPGVKKFFNCDIFLKHLSKVQILELTDTNCSDRSLMIISEICTELKTLDLYCCEKVTDKGLEYLCQKKLPLETLNVELTSVSYKGVAMLLKSIPSLSKLCFDNVPRAILEAAGLNDPSGEADNSLFNLGNISILNNPMRPENHLTMSLKVCTMLCPLIKDLFVAEIILKEQLHLCSKFQNLELVNLQCSSIVSPKLCINDFVQVRGDKIRILTLTSFCLSVDVLASCCKNLECLTLQYPTFLELKSTGINFPCLRTFNLQNASLDSKETQNSTEYIISSSSNLQELHVVYCLFSDEMSKVILQYPNKLKTLNFSNTIINANFIEEILRVHSSLVNLLIENSGISCAEYDDLMDIVDNMANKVHVVWADYSEAIRELYNTDFDSVFEITKRYILKL